MDLAQALIELWDRYGTLAIVAGALAVVVVHLDRKRGEERDKRIAELKEGHAEALKVLREALDSERTQKEAALARLDSNTAALREATVGFTASTNLMEKLVDRDERPEAGRRGRGTG